MMLARVFLCLRSERTACLLPNQTPFTLMLWVRSQIFSGVLMASCQDVSIRRLKIENRASTYRHPVHA